MNYSLLDDGQKKKQVELENPETRTLEEMEELPEEYLSEDGVDFWKTTSLKQRFDQPEHQPELTKDLYPRFVIWNRLSKVLKEKSVKCVYRYVQPVDNGRQEIPPLPQMRSQFAQARVLPQLDQI